MSGKRVWKVIARILEVLLLLVAVLALVLHNHYVQTRLADAFVSTAEKSLRGKVSFSDIRLVPFNTLVIEDLILVETEPLTPCDTLVYAKRLSANFSLRELFRITRQREGGLTLRRLMADGLEVNFAFFAPDEDGNTFNLNRIFRIKNTDNSMEPEEVFDIFSIGRVSLKNSRFRMKNFTPGLQPYSGHGINWADMDLDIPQAKMQNFGYTDGRFHTDIRKLEATDKCGYRVWAEGYMGIAKGLIEIRDAHIWDDLSDLNVVRYSMQYNEADAFEDYLNKVEMNLKLKPSRLAMQTVSAYAVGILCGCPLVFDLGEASGNGIANDLKINSLSFNELYSGISGDVDFSMHRLFGTADDSNIDATIRSLNFSTEEIQKLLSALGLNDIDISDYAKGVKADLSGSANGWIDHLDSKGTLTSNCGSISFEAATRELDRKGDFSFDGKVALNEVDLGRFLNTPSLGQSTLSAHGSGRYEGKITEVELDTLSLGKLVFGGYPYQNIQGKGSYKDGRYDAVITSDDPNATFELTGRLISKDGTYTSDAKLDVKNFDLEKTLIDRRGGGSLVKGKVDLAASLDPSRNIRGSLKASDVSYSTLTQDGNIGDFSLVFLDSAQESDAATTHIMRLTSPSFGKIEYRSSLPVSSFPEFLKGAVISRYAPSVTMTAYDSSKWEGQSFSADAVLFDTQDLLLPLKTDLYIARGTNFSLKLRKRGRLTFDFDSDVLRIGDSRLKDIHLAADNYSGPLRLRNVGGASASLPNLNFTDIELGITAAADTFSLDLFTNGDKIQKALISLGIALQRTPHEDLCIRGTFGESAVGFNDTVWRIKRGSASYDSSGSLNLKDIGMYSGEQSLDVNGGISTVTPSELRLKLDRFDLSSLRNFIHSETFPSISGHLSGDGSYRTPIGDNTGLEVNLYTDMLSLGGSETGTLSVNAIYDDEDERLHFNLIHRNPIGLEDIKVRKEESSADLTSAAKNLQATINFSGFDPALFTPFVKDLAELESGSIDGKVYVGYDFTSRNLDISRSYLTVSDFFTLIPTGIRYKLGADLRGDSKGLEIRSLTLDDNAGGNARLSGRPEALTASLRNLLVVSPSGKSELFEGNLRLSGNANMAGNDGREYRLKSNLSTQGSGNLKIFIGDLGTSETSTVFYLRSTDSEAEEDQRESAYLQARAERKRREQELAEVQHNRGLHFIADVSLTTGPEVSLGAELAGTGDIAISVNGAGTVNLDYDSETEGVSLGGDYTVNEGDFKFSAASLISKDFSISNGSSLRFSGDVMDTDLDITANNTVKASLGPLISDTTSVSTRRDVICTITVSGKLREPQLKFGVDIPNLDPTTAALVQSELNTEDKVQKQFLALVATGSFVPSNQSGVTNQLSTSLLYSSLASFASGQLNSILQSVGIPVDVGLGYTQNEAGNNIVDLNVSTQFFGNRVVVSGTVGNRQYSTTSSDNVVGDIDIEVKLDKAGRFRTKLFSHSADDYTNYLDNTQRSGIGVSYQREFNSIRDFIGEIFRKNRNEEIAEEARRRSSITTIQIQ